MENPVSPSLQSLDSVACRTRHVTVLPDSVVPTIIVLCREFLVSYNCITFVTVSASGCNILSFSSVNTACFICTLSHQQFINLLSIRLYIYYLIITVCGSDDSIVFSIVAKFFPPLFSVYTTTHKPLDLT